MSLRIASAVRPAHEWSWLPVRELRGWTGTLLAQSSYNLNFPAYSHFHFFVLVAGERTFIVIALMFQHDLSLSRQAGSTVHSTGRRLRGAGLAQQVPEICNPCYEPLDVNMFGRLKKAFHRQLVSIIANVRYITKKRCEEDSKFFFSGQDCDACQERL